MLLRYLYVRTICCLYGSRVYSALSIVLGNSMERERQETTAWIFGSGCECLVGYPLNAIINYWKNKNKNTPYSSDRRSTPFVSLIHSSNAALYHIMSGLSS